MKGSGTFEDLYVWKEAIHLAKEIFLLYEGCKVYSMKNQLERASISISANIAEGFELDTVKQFVKHLYIAKGSCGEVRSLLYFSREMTLYSDVELTEVMERSRKLSVMIYNLIKSKRGGK